MKSFKYNIIALGLLGLAITSCKEPEYPTPTPATTPSTAQAFVMAHHFSADAPAVDVYLDNTKIATASYGDILVNQAVYAPIPAGFRQIRLKATTQDTSVLVNRSNYATGTNWSVFVVDAFATKRLSGVVIQDQFLTLAAGKVGLRFLNLSNDSRVSASTGVILANDSLGTSKIFNDQRVFKAVAFGSGSSAVQFNRYTSVDAYTSKKVYVLKNDAAKTFVSSFVLNTVAGQSYTLALVGTGNSGAKALDLKLIRNK